MAVYLNADRTNDFCSSSFGVKKSAKFSAEYPESSDKARSVALDIICGSVVVSGAIVGGLAAAGVVSAVWLPVAGACVLLGGFGYFKDSFFYDYENPDVLKKLRQEALIKNFTSLMQQHSWENILQYGIPSSKIGILRQIQQFKEKYDAAKDAQHTTIAKANREFEGKVKGKRLILNAALEGADLAYFSHPAHAKLRSVMIPEERRQCERELELATRIWNGAKNAARYAFDQATTSERKHLTQSKEKAHQTFEMERNKINQQYRAMCRLISVN